MKITESWANDILHWHDDMAANPTAFIGVRDAHRDAAALVRQLQAELQDACRAQLELLETLKMARAELAGLPHSLGYEFTHLPKIDAAIGRAQGNGEDRLVSELELLEALKRARAEAQGSGEVEYEFEVWQNGSLQASGSTSDQATAKSEADHYAAMYGQDGPVEVRLFMKRQITAPPSVPVGVAEAWQQGYHQGVQDERTSEANIGIAGFGAKVEPARINPYLAQQPAPSAPVEVEGAVRAFWHGYNGAAVGAGGRQQGRTASGVAAVLALAQQPAAVDDADRDDARRYRALVATGKYVPAMREGWGLACGHSKASKAELDAAADALTAQPATSGYTCTVPDDCETLHWRGQILSMNELASVAQPAAVDGECAIAAIQFALNDPEGMTFLRLWNEGEFETLRREWPEAPSSIYIGADPLAQQPAAVDEAYPTPRNRAEAVALARLALAHLGVIDAHIDAAITRCETDSATQPGPEALTMTADTIRALMVERDAARYRQWRDKMISQDHNFIEAMQDSLPHAVGMIRPPTADEWDAAIDATMQSASRQEVPRG